MVFLGFACFASLLVYSDVSALYTLGLLIRPLFLAVLGHLLLALPSGRLPGRIEQTIVLVAYLNTTVLVATAALFFEPETSAVRNLGFVFVIASTR